MNAKIPPGLSQRRTMRQELVEPGARHVAQPEPGEQRVDRPIRLGPRVAHVQVRPQAMRDQALARPIERRRCRRRRATARPCRRGAATTSRCRRRARRSRRGSAGRPASARPRRARRSRRRRGRGRARTGRGADTSRRIPGRGPRSRRASRHRDRSSAGARPGPCVGRGAGRPARRSRLGGGRGRRPPAAAAAAPRSVSAWCSRNRRKPLSPALPTQSEQSCAQPSRSSGPRHAYASPHHRQSKVARNGI